MSNPQYIYNLIQGFASPPVQAAAILPYQFAVSFPATCCDVTATLGPEDQPFDCASASPQARLYVLSWDFDSSTIRGYIVPDEGAHPPPPSDPEAPPQPDAPPEVEVWSEVYEIDYGINRPANRASIRETATAEFSGATVPSNNEDLVRLFKAIFMIYAGWASIAFDITFLGCWVLGTADLEVDLEDLEAPYRWEGVSGLIEAYEVDYGLDEAGNPILRTRMTSPPQNWFPEQLNHDLSADSTCNPCSDSRDVRIGLTTTVITARSGATMGTGLANFYRVVAGDAGTSTMKLGAITDEAGARIYNYSHTPIASGIYVFLKQVGCAWTVVSAEC
jgi:hypothetical protein